MKDWSPLQEAVFAHRANPAHEKTNLMVEAYAGSGKSTTIEELVTRLPIDRKAGIFAFGKDIADAMRARLDDPSFDVGTWHSFGFRALRCDFSRVQIDNMQLWKLLNKVPKKLKKAEKNWIVKLIGLAKGSLQGPDGLLDFAQESGHWAPKGSDERALVAIARSLLIQQAKPGRRTIDFDDMVWLPVTWDLELLAYDDVIVDEAQDLNPAQLELAMRTASRGRMTAVGDRFQSIYQFRGADSEAIPRIIRETSADRLPLSVTYRCAQSIVDEARWLVPDLTARPGAPDGRVSTVDEDFMYEQAQPGDFVISRLNAPLVKLAYSWIKAGVPCEIKGRNIGQDLVNFIEQQEADTIPELIGKISAWRDAKLEDETLSDRAKANADDRALCVLEIAQDQRSQSVTALVNSLEELFADSDQPGSLITLSSTHKAKGLEAEKVWLLRDTYNDKGGIQEEMNLFYVAQTRAKNELVYVKTEAA
jgi:DNA helicase II / ATP-dependent DNA helicase PcrA